MHCRLHARGRMLERKAPCLKTCLGRLHMFAPNRHEGRELGGACFVGWQMQVEFHDSAERSLVLQCHTNRRGIALLQSLTVAGQVEVGCRPRHPKASTH